MHYKKQTKAQLLRIAKARYESPEGTVKNKTLITGKSFILGKIKRKKKQDNIPSNKNNMQYKIKR